MKFSYNWLCELVEGVETDPRELGRLITMKTAECEGVEEYGAHFAEVCAALVVKVEPIEGSHVQQATVETGRYGLKTVVCGAPNCREGMKAAYVPAGVTLGGQEIRVSEIRGVMGDGMLASGAELGVNGDADGILDIEASPGDPIPGCVPDHILEIDNKSLTHRPDLWGHFGMAREVAAILRKPLRDPVHLGLLPEGEAAISVAVEDFELCPRYSALTFENVTVGPSPVWMQYRLESIGLNAINNLVDVTNYVLSEIAQPMHAFDWDALAGSTVIARAAREGEFLTALNEETYRLTPADCVIADRDRAVAIGGVMGGLDTRVTGSTRRVVLESANFHASTIRRTSSRLKLRTDASIRFEKSQDPANTVRGLARAIELFRQVSPDMKMAGGLADIKKQFAEPPPIALQLEWLARKIGRRVSRDEVKRILVSLEFGVEEVNKKTLAVTAPSWRATRDVSIEEDLVEEVGRMIGYDSIPLEAPDIPSTAPPPNEERAFHAGLRAIAIGQGFTEVSNYSFVSEQTAAEFGLDPAAHLRVINPIAADQNLLRTSLIPGIVRNLRDNSRHLGAFRLFEIGYEIHKKPAAKTLKGRGTEALPEEIAHLAAAVYAREGDGAAGLYEREAFGRVSDARLRIRSDGFPALRASFALLQSELARRDAGTDLRTASQHDRRPGRIARRRCTGYARSRPRRKEIRAAAALSLQRFRPFRGHGFAGTLREHRAPANRPRRRDPRIDRIPSPLHRRSPARGLAVSLLPPDRVRRRSHTHRRRTYRDPRPHHRRNARSRL